MKSNRNLIDYRIEFIIGIHTPFIDSIDVCIDCFIRIKSPEKQKETTIGKQSWNYSECVLLLHSDTHT